MKRIDICMDMQTRKRAFAEYAESKQTLLLSGLDSHLRFACHVEYHSLYQNQKQRYATHVKHIINFFDYRTCTEFQKRMLINLRHTRLVLLAQTEKMMY